MSQAQRESITQTTTTVRNVSVILSTCVNKVLLFYVEGRVASCVAVACCNWADLATHGGGH